MKNMIQTTGLIAIELHYNLASDYAILIRWKTIYMANYFSFVSFVYSPNVHFTKSPILHIHNMNWTFTPILMDLHSNLWYNSFFGCMNIRLNKGEFELFCEKCQDKIIFFSHIWSFLSHLEYIKKNCEELVDPISSVCGNYIWKFDPKLHPDHLWVRRDKGQKRLFFSLFPSHVDHILKQCAKLSEYITIVYSKDFWKFDPKLHPDHLQVRRDKGKKKTVFLSFPLPCGPHFETMCQTLRVHYYSIW